MGCKQHKEGGMAAKKERSVQDQRKCVWKLLAVEGIQLDLNVHSSYLCFSQVLSVRLLWHWCAPVAPASVLAEPTQTRRQAQRCHSALVAAPSDSGEESPPGGKASLPPRRAKLWKTGHKTEPVHRANNYVFPTVPQPHSHYSNAWSALKRGPGQKKKFRQ